MKKIILLPLLPVVMISFLTASAYGWGSATHAYIAKELGKEFGLVNLQEMYGSTLPDMVNLKNIPPMEPYNSLYAKFHFIEEGSQEAIINQAKWCLEEAFVYGFASHNDAWGADYTAHHNAASIPGPDLGYVTEKKLEPIAELGLMENLSAILIDAGFPLEQALILAAALTPTVTELGIEVGVDILIKRNEDPAIGLRLFISALFRDSCIPNLLARAYSGSDEALTEIIINSEREFRDMMVLYGKALLLDEEAAINGIITQWIPVVSGLVEKLYPGIEISKQIEERFIALGVEVVNEGIRVCESDYYDEIWATIDAVGERLEKEGIHTCIMVERPLTPDIKVNGSDGPITLNQSDTLSITVALDNNGIMDNANWWLVAGTPFGIYFYTFDGWTTDWVPAYQGPLFYLEPFEVLNIPLLGLQPGTYTLCFGVNTYMNGNVTCDSVYYDTIVVNVTE